MYFYKLDIVKSKRSLPRRIEEGSLSLSDRRSKDFDPVLFTYCKTKSQVKIQKYGIGTKVWVRNLGLYGFRCRKDQVKKVSSMEDRGHTPFSPFTDKPHLHPHS